MSDLPVVLEPKHVHVWLARASDHAAHESTFRQLLDSSERARAQRFHYDSDRQQFTVAHGILRILLSQYCGVSPNAIRIATGEYGKPYIEQIDTPLQFNVSHSGDLVAVALCLESAIGVDIERWQDIEYELLAKTVFSETEQRTLAAIATDLQGYAFFSCWTRKEAYIKATGLGVSQGLDYFDVSLTPGDPAELIDDRRPNQSVNDWSMYELTVPNGYSGALVVQGKEWTVHPAWFTL